GYISALYWGAVRWGKCDLRRVPYAERDGRPVDLSLLDGKRIAVVFQRDESSFVVRGTARYELDRLQGNSLRILLQEGGEGGEGDPHVIVYERAGGLTIRDDPMHSRDYCVAVASTPPGPVTTHVRTG